MRDGRTEHLDAPLVRPFDDLPRSLTEACGRRRDDQRALSPAIVQDAIAADPVMGDRLGDRLASSARRLAKRSSPRSVLVVEPSPSEIESPRTVDLPAVSTSTPVGKARV